MSTNANQEIAAGERFGFGANWDRFLKVLNEDRINESVLALKTMVECENFQGRTFVDIGSGSGLSSLAAMKLGAKRVHSFDFDPKSVACTKELKRRYFPDASNWTIEQASALDVSYLSALGQFDIVYSWGVLHHTGQMWAALENIVPLINSKGKLFIAIYNDQGSVSKKWLRVKRLYNKNIIGRWLMTGIYCTKFFLEALKMDLVRHRSPSTYYRNYRKARGMSAWHDWIDWIGGYPFEVATPDAIFDFYKKKNLILTKLITRQGLGCNEFVFCKM